MLPSTDQMELTYGEGGVTELNDASVSYKRLSTYRILLRAYDEIALLTMPARKSRTNTTGP